MHWTLEVNNGMFSFTRDDGVGVAGEDHDLSGGYVGIQLYAQQAEFDNLTITPIVGTAVEPTAKAATLWGDLKIAR